MNNLVVRRVCIRDNYHDLARLIYLTDPYIYPCWFGNNQERATMEIMSLMHKPGVYFNPKYLYAAYLDDQAVGIMGVLPMGSLLTKDYPMPHEGARRAVEHYALEIVKQVQESKPRTVIVSNLCVDPEVRSKGIARGLMREVMFQMQKEGYNRFELDCLADNFAALHLYGGLGFEIVGRGLGFGGFMGRPNVVSMVRTVPAS